ncbi:MAG TPA: PQQ-binding-like beta-propeller repeat protein [Ktedonobacterales bacterium]|jgi:outer membrane protein assembly factor BamB
MMNSGLLVVASYDGSIQALHAHDGSTCWTHQSAHPFMGRALARLADSVIAEAADGYVVALAIDDGAVRWETTLPDATLISEEDNVRVEASRTQVVVQLGLQCFCVNAADGRILWRGAPSPESRGGWWVLAVTEERVYVVAREGPQHYVTVALSAWDGTPQWGTIEQSAGEPPWDTTPPLVEAEADGVVYTYGLGLHAIEAATGRLLWSQAEIPYFRVGSLAIWRDEVIVQADRLLGAYRRDTGVPVWLETFPRPDDYFEGFAGVQVVGERIYSGHASPTLGGYRVEARAGATGVVQWIWPPQTENDPERYMRFEQSWRFRGEGNTLYIPSLGDVWAIDARNGTQRWHRAIDPAEPKAFLAIDPAND